MKWPHFLRGTKKEKRTDAKSSSFRSNSNTSTDYGLKISSSEFNSQNISDTSTGSIERFPYPSFNQRPCSLKVFTYQELRNATKNFGRTMMIGEGGFGHVYKGTINDFEDPQGKKLEIAVKQLKHNGMQGQKQWSAEVNVLGVAKHPNLVKLLGYCAEDDERGIQRLLVYEFVPNNCVQSYLSYKSSAVLSWPMRLKVALDAARGLTYLHEGMEYQIIFRDFKTSNILLDEEWNAKLSDFGLARNGPQQGLSHVSTAVVGTYGYAAPDYIQTGRLTAKSDVWSFGVVLYELITGRPPIDQNLPRGEQKLLEWIRPYISDRKRFRVILDPRLQGQYSIKSAVKLGTIANKCLVRQPRSRPKMSEILQMVQKIVDETTEAVPPQPPLVTCASKKNVEGLKKRNIHVRETESSTKEGKNVRFNLRRVGQLIGVERFICNSGNEE